VIGFRIGLRLVRLRGVVRRGLVGRLEVLGVRRRGRGCGGGSRRFLRVGVSSVDSHTPGGGTISPPPPVLVYGEVVVVVGRGCLTCGFSAYACCEVATGL